MKFTKFLRFLGCLSFHLPGFGTLAVWQKNAKTATHIFFSRSPLTTGHRRWQLTFSTLFTLAAELNLLKRIREKQWKHRKHSISNGGPLTAPSHVPRKTDKNTWTEKYKTNLKMFIILTNARMTIFHYDKERRTSSKECSPAHSVFPRFWFEDDPLPPRCVLLVSPQADPLVCCTY